MPGAVPAVLAEDAGAGMFVMEYLEPDVHPVWKSQLRDGVIEPQFAALVGARIAQIHAHTARNEQFARQFATDHIFFPIRLEPYLIATAHAHRDCAAQLEALAKVTASTKVALVHGDVSPKNILCSAHGPVFLDAECAWFGDPAFDLAFSLNHLLLKCLWRPSWVDRYLDCFDALARAYLHGATWEPAALMEARAARLLPGLLLARVDGKSPVEYLTAEAARAAVRRCAGALLHDPPSRLLAVSQAWWEELVRS